jgi:hypothetical protein
VKHGFTKEAELLKFKPGMRVYQEGRVTLSNIRVDSLEEKLDSEYMISKTNPSLGGASTLAIRGKAVSKVADANGTGSSEVITSMESLSHYARKVEAASEVMEVNGSDSKSVHDNGLVMKRKYAEFTKSFLEGSNISDVIIDTVSTSVEAVPLLNGLHGVRVSVSVCNPVITTAANEFPVSKPKLTLEGKGGIQKSKTDASVCQMEVDSDSEETVMSEAKIEIRKKVSIFTSSICRSLLSDLVFDQSAKPDQNAEEFLNQFDEIVNQVNLDVAEKLFHLSLRVKEVTLREAFKTEMKEMKKQGIHGW